MVEEEATTERWRRSAAALSSSTPGASDAAYGVPGAGMRFGRSPGCDRWANG